MAWRFIRNTISKAEIMYLEIILTCSYLMLRNLKSCEVIQSFCSWRHSTKWPIASFNCRCWNEPKLPIQRTSSAPPPSVQLRTNHYLNETCVVFSQVISWRAAACRFLALREWMRKKDVRNVPELSQIRVVMIAIIIMIEMMSQSASRAQATARSFSTSIIPGDEKFSLCELHPPSVSNPSMWLF